MVEVDKEHYDTVISSLQESNEELLTKISSLTDTVGGLKTTVQGNKQDYLLDSKTSFGSLQQHGSQVLSLNGQFHTLNGDVQTLKGAVKTIETLKVEISTLKSKLVEKETYSWNPFIGFR